MPKYTIIAESGADIPAILAERYNIPIVPMHVSFGGKTYDDGTMPVEDIFAHFDTTKELPATSGSTPADFKKVFDEIHAADPDSTIIHLAYSAVTTCSYESAVTAAEGRDYVRHFDTKGVSAGQAAIVLSVADYVAKNPNVDIEELTLVIEDRIARMHMGFLPGDLAYLHAGGRLSNASYFGAQLLKVRPFVEIVDGKLVGTKMYRGSAFHTAKKMVETYLKKVSFDKELLYLVESPGLGRDIKDMVETLVAEAGFQKTQWIQTGCVVSSHGGPAAVGIVGFSAK